MGYTNGRLTDNQEFIESNLYRDIHGTLFPRFHLILRFSSDDKSLTVSLHLDERRHRSSSLASNQHMAELQRLVGVLKEAPQILYQERITKALINEMLFGGANNIARWEKTHGQRYDQKHTTKVLSRKPRGTQKTLMIEKRRRFQEQVQFAEESFS